MRSLLIICFLLLGIEVVMAQKTLIDWNQDRLLHTERSMWVLTTWATANVAIGAIGMRRSNTPEQRAFQQMNLGWGLINLGLAGSGLWNATHSDPSGLDWWSSQQELLKTQQIFLFNTGLDVGYVAAGFWMQERAKTATRHADRWRGFGRSIVLQGAFLFVFDLGAYLYHRPLGQELREFLPVQSLQIGMTSEGFGLRYRF
jgi:hypothetical protein